jgi:hypothetical protein
MEPVNDVAVGGSCGSFFFFSALMLEVMLLSSCHIQVPGPFVAMGTGEEGV